MRTKILSVKQGKVIEPVSELHTKDVRIAELQDALKFSERMVVKLARMMFCPNDEKYPCRHGEPKLGCMRLKTKLTSTFAVHCEDCILRKVRLEVEEEMEHENS